MARALGLPTRGRVGWAAILSMLCIGGCVNVMARTPTDANARSEQSAVAIVRAYEKASKSGLISLDFGSPVKEAESRRTFGRWWCTRKPTETALDELRNLLSAHCAERNGIWRPHSDGMSAWCETSDEDGLLFFTKMGGNYWDKQALKSLIVPASARRGFNCSETRAGLERNPAHRDVDVYAVEAVSGGPLDEAYVQRLGFVPKIDRYRKAYAAATSVPEWEAFIATCIDYDPDALCATARDRLAQAHQLADRYAEQDAAERERAAKKEAAELRLLAERKRTAPVGTRLCNFGTGTQRNYTGMVAVTGARQFNTERVKLKIVGFLEGRSEEKFQIRVGGIEARNGRDDVITGGQLDYQGVQLAPGILFWDDASNWQFCE